MRIPGLLRSLIGGWAGTNKLWLMPGEPERVSDGTAEIAAALGGRLLSIAYTWAEDGPQDGLIIIGQEEESSDLQAVWVDSWHQPAYMLCRGTLDDSGRIAVQGKYAAPEGPDWGWEIAIEPAGCDEFVILMDNITPDIQHFRAVEMTLGRRR